MEDPKTQTLLWAAPECRYRVSIPASLLNEIRIAVVEAFYSVPRGGVEIGGVFFGTRDRETLRIRATRPIKCEYSTGPSFTLSAKDQLNLAAVLCAPGSDPELAGMTVLGWYHSHTRSEIALSPTDLQVHKDYFPEAWQIAMMLRPANLQPTRGAIFFRDGSGSVKTNPGAREFTMDPPAFGLKIVTEDNVAPAAAQTSIQTPAREIAVTPDAEPVVRIGLPSFDHAESTAKRRRGNGWIWTLAAVILVSVATGGAVLKWPKPDKAASLGLETYDVNGAFLIRWDRDSSLFRQASRVTLEIQDGNTAAPVELDRRALALGGYGYVRRSSQVSVHMKVEGPTPADEFSNFVAAASNGETQNVRAADEKERLKTELINESIQTQDLRRTITDLRKQLAEERARNSGANSR